VDVLAFEFEMGLFPASLDEAKQKGIDLAPKTIPPEVFDKRAVEKGQVRFFDVAYIEVTPRFDPKDKLTLAVELTDFSVYYSQGIADSIAAEMKEGKSEVVCEQGQYELSNKDPDVLVFGIKDNFKKSFGAARSEAGLTDVRLHDLRHTHATRLVAAHIPLGEVGRVLGHTQPSTTYRYVNANRETARRAAAALDLFNAGEEEKPESIN
jgi:Phage integrase family